METQNCPQQRREHTHMTKKQTQWRKCVGMGQFLTSYSCSFSYMGCWVPMLSDNNLINHMNTINMWSQIRYKSTLNYRKKKKKKNPNPNSSYVWSLLQPQIIARFSSALAWNLFPWWLRQSGSACCDEI